MLNAVCVSRIDLCREPKDGFSLAKPHTASAAHSFATSSNLSFMDKFEARAGTLEISKLCAQRFNGAEVEQKRTPTPYVSACTRSPLTCPWPAGGHGLQPPLQAREPAAHTGTVSEQCLAKMGKIIAATRTDFGPDGFRRSSLTTVRL